MMTRDKFEELIKILKHEEYLLISGNIGELMKISTRRDELIGELENLNPAITKEQVEEIKSMAQYNMKLISAARQGISNVRKRLGEVNRLISGTQTYGCNGHRIQLNDRPPKEDISY